MKEPKCSVVEEKDVLGFIVDDVMDLGKGKERRKCGARRDAVCG